jgi:hypothetical protein
VLARVLGIEATTTALRPIYRLLEAEWPLRRNMTMMPTSTDAMSIITSLVIGQRTKNYRLPPGGTVETIDQRRAG